MAVTILDGFRELEPGEIIKQGDYLYPAGGDKFKRIAATSKSLGKPYKNVDTPLLQETIVIRAKIRAEIETKKEEIEYGEVFCSNVDYTTCEQIYGIVAASPILSRFEGAVEVLKKRYDTGFYLLVRPDGKFLGFTSAAKDQFAHFRKAMEIDNPTLLEYLKCGKKALKISQKSFWKEIVIVNRPIAEVPFLQEI